MSEDRHPQSPARASRIQERLDELRRRLNAEIDEAERSIEKVAAEAEKAPPGASRLRAALSDVAAGDDQSDILDRLVRQSGTFARRVAFLIVQETRLKGWSCTGIEDREEGFDRFEQDADGAWAVAVATGSSLYVDQKAAIAVTADPTPLAGEAMLVPFVLRGKVEALLYVDQADSGDPLPADEIQILCHGAAQSLDLVSVRQGGASALRRQDEGGDDAAPVPQPEPAGASPPRNEPKVAAPAEEPSQAPPPVETQIEVAAPETAAESEAPQPAVVASPPLPTQVMPPSDLDGPGTAFRPAGLENEADEQDPRRRAQQLAAFLVSEIELYNEERLAEARRAKDVQGLLNEDIELARTIYEERTDDEILAASTYFDDEILRVLAAGDPSLLGR